MLLLKAEQLKKSWQGNLIFQNVNLEIHQGERIALIGRNGVGKTTLLECLLGRVTPDGGKIDRPLPVSEWGVVEQHLLVADTLTLREFIQSGHLILHRLKKELHRLEEMMTCAEGEKLITALDRYSNSLERYQTLGGYQWEHGVEAILDRFDLPGDNLYRELSGGQKTKAQLARVMAGNPSFLLLDEPTNHLDLETLNWLTGWVQRFQGTVLLVSHDRDFIDRVATKTVELTPQGTKTCPGGYADFLRERERERREQESLYKKQQQEKKKLEEAIRRYREWFLKAHAAAGERNPFYKKKAEKNRTRFRAKEKALERLDQEQVKRPRDLPGIQVDIKGGIFRARQLVRVEDMSFSYGRHPVLQDVNLTISRGDRLAVVGPNGSGKTTLLQLLSGRLQPGTGSVMHHPQLSIGYFAQELNNLNKDETILDSLLRLPGMTQREARNILAGFFFRRDEVFRKIGTLSMGERCRVAFVNLYFSRANLLILDEPTNYLDIVTREQMEEALARYPGALVVVSHDRYLLNKVSNRVACLREGQLIYYPGNYAEFQQYLHQCTNRSHDQAREDRLLTLQLQLAQLMAAEEPEDEVDRKALAGRIYAIRDELDKLKQDRL